MEKREIVSNISYVETFELKQQLICYLVNIIELLIVLLDMYSIYSKVLVLFYILFINR